MTPLLLTLLMAAPPVDVDLDRAKAAVAVELAKLAIKPAPVVPKTPIAPATPGVVVQSPFTPTGTVTTARPVAVPNTSSPVTYRVVGTRTLANTTGQFGVINCTYG